MRRFIAGLACVVFLFSCSDNEDKDSKKIEEQGPAFALQLKDLLPNESMIVDFEGKPISNATVLIGQKVGSFEGNVTNTNEQGVFTLPSNWQNEEMVTIFGSGLVKTTYTKVKPEQKKFYVRRALRLGSFELKGVTSGFQITNQDGLVDFAVVIPAFDRKDLFQLDLNAFISPQNDVIRAAGQEIEIPSNISLPDQRESYFIPIQLNKPNYRSYFSTPGSRRMVALRGQFPLEEVVNGVRGNKHFFDLINFFNMTGFGSGEVNISKSTQTANFNVNQNSFQTARRVTGPLIADDQMIVAISLTLRNGEFIPVDFKKLESRADQPLITHTSSPQLLLALRKKSESSEMGSFNERMALTLLPFANNMQGATLPLIANPSVKSHLSVSFPQVSTPRGLKVVGQIIQLAKVETIALGGVDSKVNRPLWDIYTQSWDRQLQLPQLPNNESARPSGTLKWSVAFLGTQMSISESPFGLEMIDKTTHLTQSAQEF